MKLKTNLPRTRPGARRVCLEIPNYYNSKHLRLNFLYFYALTISELELARSKVKELEQAVGAAEQARLKAEQMVTKSKGENNYYILTFRRIRSLSVIAYLCQMARVSTSSKMNWIRSDATQTKWLRVRNYFSKRTVC
jgi:hypothetical protein